jgi:quercetin dioxygenase-like cupin family protein
MDIKQFINSGILEIYCMGIASDEERIAVESYASRHVEVQEEINAINAALLGYAEGSGKTIAPGLRKKTLEAITKQNFPLLLSGQRNIQWWLEFIDALNINLPAEYEIHLVDLPGDEIRTNYIAWAKKGASIEESHGDEDEYLLMVKGSCTITVDGHTTKYLPGDLIYIPKGKVHTAVVISEEPMIVIGQRLAA